jgi:hypothetical protein
MLHSNPRRPWCHREPPNDSERIAWCARMVPTGLGRQNSGGLQNGHCVAEAVTGCPVLMGAPSPAWVVHTESVVDIRIWTLAVPMDRHKRYAISTLDSPGVFRVGSVRGMTLRDFAMVDQTRRLTYCESRVGVGSNHFSREKSKL